MDPRDLERLDRAIERLTARQPVPVFEEDDLEELMALAGRLHRELPDDLPDPMFRESLREQLIDPRPRPVPSPPRRATRRNPLLIAGTAIVATVVIVVAASAMLSNQFGSAGGAASDDPVESEQIASSTRVAAVATATATVGSVAVVSTRETELASPTPDPVTIPPLDAAHVEFGATGSSHVLQAANDGEVTYSLASSMPDAPPSATVYRFAVPEVDALSMMNQLTDALNLDGEMTTHSVRGKTVFSFTSTNGTTFTWMPESGAFACKLSGEARVRGEPEEIVAATYQWLRTSGFPVRDGSVAPVIQHLEGGAMRVDFPVETAPPMTVGHPLSVSVIIDHRGVIKTVSGYWIQLIDTLDIDLLSAEDAWAALADGKGYWSSTSPIELSGKFEVESFQVTYVLTVDDNNELVLQPVYRATGKFEDYRGEVVEGVSIMVQAVTQPELQHLETAQ